MSRPRLWRWIWSPITWRRKWSWQECSQGRLSLFYPKGGRQTAFHPFPPAISICENFGPFFPLKMIPWYSKRIFCHCEGAEKCLFQALFVISFWQTQASSDGATRIYAQPKMVKNGKKIVKIRLSRDNTREAICHRRGSSCAGRFLGWPTWLFFHLNATCPQMTGGQLSKDVGASLVAQKIGWIETDNAQFQWLAVNRLMVKNLQIGARLIWALLKIC